MASVIETPTGLRILAAHLAPIQALAGAQTKDGHGLILSAGGDDTIRSWDATTGEENGFTRSSGGVVSFLSVAPVNDGYVVVCVNRKGVQRWDLATGQSIGEPIRPADPRSGPAGRTGPIAVPTVAGTTLLVGGGADGAVRRWELLTGAPVGSPSTGHDGEVLSLGWLRLRDGRVVVVSGGRDGTVRRWDASTGEPIGALMSGHRAPVVAVTCLSAMDGRDIVVSQTAGGAIHRWDAGTGEPVGSPMNLDGRGLPGQGLAVTPDGRVLFSVGWNGSLWRWDLAEVEPTARPLWDRLATVKAIAVVPAVDGGPLLVTGGEQGRLRRWDAAGHPWGEPLVGHPAAVRHMVAVPATAETRGRALLVSQGRDGARCWDAETGRPVGTDEAMVARNGLALSSLPDGRLLLGTGVPEGIARHDVLGTPGIGWSPGAEDVEIWDVAAGTLPDGRRFFVGAGVDGFLYRVDAQTGESLGQPLEGLEDQALAVAVAALPDGLVMVAGGGADQTIRRWNALTGEPIGDLLTGHQAWLTRLAFVAPPGGPVMLVSVDDDGEVRRWDAISGRPVGEPFLAGEDITEVRLTVASTARPPQFVTVGSDEVLRRWDATSGQLLEEVPNTVCGTVLTLPDGTGLLALGAADGTISVGRLPAAEPHVRG